MKIKSFACNPIEENCYVVSGASGEAVIIDCGALFDNEQDAIDDYIKENNLHPVHLIFTHGHLDHCFGLVWASETYGLVPELSKADEWLVSDLEKQAKRLFGLNMPFASPEEMKWIGEGDVIAFGNSQLVAYETPGHTPGGLVFYDKEEGNLFTGDTLFRESVGRTDFERGSYEQLVASIAAKIKPLPPTTKVWPGHGPSSTIEHEMSCNPFFNF